MPDLTVQRQRAEAMLDDTVTITTDPQGAHDDTLDLNTGLLVAPSPDATTVYSGPALVKPLNRAGRVAGEGGQTVYVEEYRCRLPVSAPAVKVGATVTVDAVGPNGDPTLVGRPLRVVAAPAAGIAVTRMLTCVGRSRGPAVTP